MSSQSSKSTTPSQRRNYSIKELIKMAIESSPQQALSTSDIVDWISENFPHYRTARTNWRSEVRQSLSTQGCFVGLERPSHLPGRGKIWVVVPHGYRPGDPISLPHVESVSEAMNYVLPPANPQAVVVAEMGMEQERTNPNFDLSHSDDDPRSSQSSMSSAPPQLSNSGIQGLIKMAIKSSPQQALPTHAIIEWISENFPCYRPEHKSWKNEVRRKLSEKDCFVGLNPPRHLSGRGKIWVVAPDGYRPGDPISLPHVESVGEAMNYDLPSANPQAGDAAEVGAERRMQAHTNPHFEPSHSDDAPRSSQSSTSSTPSQLSNSGIQDLIKMAIKSSPQQALPSCDIIEWISENIPYYQTARTNWRSEVRRKLNEKDGFVGLKRPRHLSGRGKIWIVAPDGYRPSDPISIGETINYDLPSANPQAGVAAEVGMEHPMQAQPSQYFEPNYSDDIPSTSRGFTSSARSQRPRSDFGGLIKMAINSCPQKKLSTSDIIDWISENFSVYQKDEQNWQTEVCETLIKEFYKVVSPPEEERHEELWAEPATEEEVSRLLKHLEEKNASMANEPLGDSALHQQPEGTFYQERENDL